LGRKKGQEHGVRVGYTRVWVDKEENNRFGDRVVNVASGNPRDCQEWLCPEKVLISVTEEIRVAYPLER